MCTRRGGGEGPAHPLVCPCFKLTSLIEHASGDDQFDTKRQSDKQSKGNKTTSSTSVQLLILRSATHFTSINKKGKLVGLQGRI